MQSQTKVSLGPIRHLFHLVYRSPWPFLVSCFLYFFVSSLAYSFYAVEYSHYFLYFSLLGLISCGIGWLFDIVLEGTFLGFHTMVVRHGLKAGFLLFVVSEVLLFFGFFWAFFHSALCPSIEIGAVYPPDLTVIPLWEFPLFNTLILIISGFSVTWAHRGLSLGSFRIAMDGLLITIFLGYWFVLLQGYEYYEASFTLSDGIYSSCFYMLTGLHGCHVIVGATFLLVCFIRLIERHFLVRHYLGLVCAIWYWHFVDVVWLFLFVSLYLWGNW